MPAARKIIGARPRSLRGEPRDRHGRARWSREKWAIKLRRASPGSIYRPLYAHLTGTSEAELFGLAKEGRTPNVEALNL
uniref:hypothetical protein n=1 Tax=Actinomadura macra TaxID=46164 RepID=UPI000AAAE497